MSTANKPTFHQALGSHASSNRGVPTALRRVRDLPGEGKLKMREAVLHVKREVPTDTPFPEDADAQSSSSSSSSDDDDDDDAELMRELARIKEERARAEETKVATANPLISTSLAGVGRRWDDDTVFKGLAGQTNQVGQKRFINDAVRSEFHRKFLNKYIV